MDKSEQEKTDRPKVFTCLFFYIAQATPSYAGERGKLIAMGMKKTPFDKIEKVSPANSKSKGGCSK